jgi:curved DNA-binding protein CbpA
MKNFDQSKDYYKVLGVRPEATKQEIERAYRNEARRRHPDGGGSEEEMKSLNEARDVLADAESRQAYDAGRAPKQAAYPASAAYDYEAASKAGTLEVPLSDDDSVGLIIGAAACFGVGLPLLALVEMQWVFFLWPLRVMTIGALVIGVLLANSALKARAERLIEAKPDYPRFRVALSRVIFWSLVVAGFAALAFYYFSYFSGKRR